MSERFSASNAARLMSCSASANLELAIPNWQPPVRDDNVGAKAKGAKIHSLVHELLSIQTVTAKSVKKFNAKDMANTAAMLQYVADLMSTRRFNILSEHEEVTDWLANPGKTTADLVLYTQDELHIIDFKVGAVPVDVFENYQLMFYAVTYAKYAPKAKGVTVHIVQPWAKDWVPAKPGWYPNIPTTSSWYVDTVRLKQFMADALAAEQKIIAKDTTFGPSDSCLFCPAYPHSRGDKGAPLCPTTLQLLYPRPEADEDAMLNLED